MGTLRDRMRADMRLRNLRPSTQESYLGCVHKFAEYHMRPPDEMGEKEVRDFLVYLRDDQERQPVTIRGYVAALKFLYANTLNRPEVVRPWFSPRQTFKLPRILSGTQVEALLNAVGSIKYRAVLMTAYGAGLRITETCNLQVDDIDSKKMLLHVREGKGGVQRNTLLSPRLLVVLRAYWKHVRPPKPYLFPGQKPGTLLSADSVRKVLHKVAEDCGIKKPVTPHLLRHSFATHLLDAGTDIRVIQVLLGHRSITSTQIYAQVSPQHLSRTKSPLDLLGTEEGKAFG